MQTSDLAICYGIYINICSMLMRIAMVGVLFLKRKRRNWNQNVTHCVSLFYVFNTPHPRGGTMQATEKSSLFSKTDLRHIEKKSLNSLYCSNLYVTFKVCFQKQKQMVGYSCYFSWQANLNLKKNSSNSKDLKRYSFNCS